MPSQVYLAVDLGAGSGRVVAGLYSGNTLCLEEVSRFSNTGMHLPTGWHWNLGQLFADIKAGLAAARRQYGDSIVSLAVDTWGVDYGLVDQRGRLLGLPWMYRDSRTDGMVDYLASLMPDGEIYRRTGIQSLFFNTLNQLAAEVRDYPAVLQGAARLLFIPDLLTYWLSGRQITERTIASTSQLLEAGTAQWDFDLARAVGIPAQLLQPLTDPGTPVGTLLPEIAAETGCGPVRVVACCSHDTASAVTGVPAHGVQPLFLSSGTWSILGREIAHPLVTDETCAAGFSNEQGLAGTTHFLKNVAGMWLLQECKRTWDAAGLTTSYGQLVQDARGSGTTALLDPNAADFEKTCDMPAAIASYLARTGQPAPATPGETTRIILESLALKYRSLVGRLRGWMPDLPDTLHIVGGGSQNALLNQMTADATGLRVVAGPIEATAVGNVLAQLLAAGEISSLAEGRELVRASFQPEIFDPGDSAAWEEKEARLAKIHPA
jgi:rhamnulokinase